MGTDLDPLTTMLNLIRLSVGSRELCHRCLAVLTTQSQRCNSNKASITRINRKYFARTYPTLLILPDGSSINIKYNIPRRIIKLPIDTSTLSPEELAMVVAK